MARRTDITKLARSRAEAPDWALSVLENWGEGSGGRRLAANVRAAVEARRSGTAFPEGLKADARRSLTAMWAFHVVGDLRRMTGPDGKPLAEAVGPYHPGRAMDSLARILPLLDRHAPGSPAREALDRVVAFLDAAAAIEPVAVPQLRDVSRRDRINAADGWGDDAGTALRAAYGALRAALEAEPGIRPAGPGPARRGAVAIPPIGKVWWEDARPRVARLLQGGHGLSVEACAASVRDGAARIDFTLARPGIRAVVRMAYGPGGATPRFAFGAGNPGAYAAMDADALVEALHDERGDPPAVRAASGILGAMDHEAPPFAVGVEDADRLRLTTLPGAVDAAGFEVALAAAEAEADRRGVRLELGLAGQVASVAALSRRGYAYAGNRGETLMARAPRPLNAPDPSRPPSPGP